MSQEVVASCVSSFPRDSAPGPTGLRAQHLHDALTAGHKGPVVEQLTLVANLLARGAAPAALAPSVAGAGLVALQKPGGGVRPIAVGEVLRRVVGKCLCAQHREQARSHFEPLQLGVACPLGAEAAVHAARDWLDQAGPGRCMLKLDISNAFNTIDRQTVLNAVKDNFPGMARWVHWCYGQPSHLRFGKHTLCSASGVQQGDPLGPLLFANALQHVLLRLTSFRHEGAGLELAAFYLDDGVLAGSFEVVAAALRLLQVEAESLGLHLNLSKCQLIMPPGINDPAPLMSLFPQALLVDPATNECRVAADGACELLGAALGPQDFCTNATRQKARKGEELMGWLSKLDDPQVALRLLRSSAGACRIAHVMRTVPPHLQLETLREYDNFVRKTFCNVTGLTPSNEEWAQACRGLKFAGLGLTSSEKHASSAYLASVTGCVDLCGRVLPQYTLDFAIASTHEAQAAQLYRSLLPSGSGMPDFGSGPLQQRQLSATVNNAGDEARLASACPADRATLISECEPGARAFFEAVPSRSMNLAVEAELFVVEIQNRLCMNDGEVDAWCPMCDAVMDSKGHHARMCCAGGDRTRRHNLLRNRTFKFAKAAGMSPEAEKTGLLLPNQPGDTAAAQGRRRPADVFLPRWVAGAPAALDFAVTCPQQQSQLSSSQHQPLAAAMEYETLKRTHLGTASACQAQGVEFIPMVVESTGAWGPAAQVVLQQMAKAASLRSGRRASDELRLFLQVAAVTLRVANARAQLRRRAAVSGFEGDCAAWAAC